MDTERCFWFVVAVVFNVNSPTKCICLASTPLKRECSVYFLLTTVSNWILTSCQPHRVTSERSDSAISKYTCQHPSPAAVMHKPFLKSIHKTSPYTDIKNTFKNPQILTSNTNCRSPFNITPVRRAHKARECCSRRPFCLIYRYQIRTL